MKNVYIKTKISILNEITKAKYTPYIYIQALPHFLKSQILSLIDREDLGKNILIPLKTKKKSQIENISSMLYHNYSSDYNREYYLTKIKFNQDNRIEEGQSTFISHKNIKNRIIRIKKHRRFESIRTR